MRVTDAQAEDKGCWKLMVGTIDGVLADDRVDGVLRKASLERVAGHIYVGSTGDGGVATLFQGVEGEGR